MRRALLAICAVALLCSACQRSTGPVDSGLGVAEESSPIPATSTDPGGSGAQSDRAEERASAEMQIGALGGGWVTRYEIGNGDAIEYGKLNEIVRLELIDGTVVEPVVDTYVGGPCSYVGTRRCLLIASKPLEQAQHSYLVGVVEDEDARLCAPMQAQLNPMGIELFDGLFLEHDWVDDAGGDRRWAEVVSCVTIDPETFDTIEVFFDTSGDNTDGG